jgi:hypothetical protein
MPNGSGVLLPYGAGKVKSATNRHPLQFTSQSDVPMPAKTRTKKTKVKASNNQVVRRTKPKRK